MNKTAGYIGLAAKAGRVSSGEVAVEGSIKAGKAALVILSSDASENTKKKFRDMCKNRDIPVLEGFTKESLGHLIGKELRTSISVNDSGFRDIIEKTWNK